jgi:hypothetical protein
MKLSLLQLAHSLPGLVFLARTIHPRWFFKWSGYSASVASHLYPHAKRRAQPFLKLVADRFDPAELKVRSRRNLSYRHLCNEIVGAWRNWEHRREDWLSIEGETFLQEAMAGGKGAFLLSGHNYGYSRLIAPVFATRGYEVHRGGNGKSVAEREGRWGKNYIQRWHYFNYEDGDYWSRVRSLNNLRQTLGRNGIIHVSPLNHRAGSPEMEMSCWWGKFYLDEKWFRVMEFCQAPVLPCFAIGDPNGTIKIIIHPPLPGERRAMASAFGKLFVGYLREYPEYARFWQAILKERPWW